MREKGVKEWGTSEGRARECEPGMRSGKGEKGRCRRGRPFRFLPANVVRGVGPGVRRGGRGVGVSSVRWPGKIEQCGHAWSAGE